MIPKNAILLGTGPLTWNREERQTDRYGSISLQNSNSDDEIIDNCKGFDIPLVMKQTGIYGELIAEVVRARESTHIGDLFRGIFPKKPEPGKILILGEGQLFHFNKYDTDSIGLKPANNRETDWLDPSKLYQVHEQTVNIYFVPK